MEPVRRAIATVVLLLAVYSTSGVALVRAGRSCCCIKKSGAACPMRARCHAGGRTCSLASTAAPAVEEQSAPAVIEAAFRLEPRRDARGRVWIVPPSPAAHATPPELPPPRRA